MYWEPMPQADFGDNEGGSPARGHADDNLAVDPQSQVGGYPYSIGLSSQESGHITGM